MMIIITGASGFLGQSLLRTAHRTWPRATILSVYSPRCGGVDLARFDAVKQLKEIYPISKPRNTVLIHAAANVCWNSLKGLHDNVAMAFNVARWASEMGIGFSVFVGTVSVYAPKPITQIDTHCKPRTLYGLGKLIAEKVWLLLLSHKRSTVVRLAGIWGWQKKPTLFWNKLLWGARRGKPKFTITRSACKRNYIPVHEASACLLHVAMEKLKGPHLIAGRDTVSMGEYIEKLSKLSSSRLSIEWDDDGLADSCIYQPGVEFAPFLNPFPEVLELLWGI